MNYDRKEIESRVTSMQTFRLGVMEEFEMKLMQDWLALENEVNALYLLLADNPETKKLADLTLENLRESK